MDSQVTLQTYVVQPVMLPLTPVGSLFLPDPTAIDPVYNVETQILKVSMVFMLPGNVSASQVSIKQYYNSAQPTKLQFYAVYNSSSTATPVAVSCSFNASPLDAAGNAITLGGIMTVFNMLKNTNGPKTSRGVATAVRTTDV